MSERRFALSMIGLGLFLLLVLGASLGMGAVALQPGQVLGALARRGGIDGPVLSIVWDFRLARVLLAALVGAALAVSGAAFQGLFRNPLADPFVIGASSGAALGATLAIVLRFGAGWAGFAPVPLAAFLGALGAVALVYLIAGVGTGAPPAVSLLLAGIALSSLFSAVVSLMMTLADRDLHRIFFWLMGGFSGQSWPQLAAALPYFLAGFVLLGFLVRPLDLLAFGEETAQGMGLAVPAARLLIVAAASLTAAAAVASGGIIGFVGLLAPHMARLLFGPGHRRLLPASGLLGAILLVLADDLARTVLAPVELPVGVLTALLGAPFFLYLLRTRQKALGGE